MSQVRTAILGLLVFAAAYLAFQNRRLLVLGGIAGAVLALVTLPYWYSALLPELAATDPREELDLERLGSGRPTFWLNDLVIFANLPLDRQLAGVGIGARGEYSVTEEEIMGHSDWLELLTQTGIVGFLLFGAIQVAILRKLLRMPLPERWGYVALFVAVNLMMLVSNSYAWRIQVSQIYYMMLAFVELPQAVAVARIAPPELSTAGRAWR
jgi:O-antigen ligase